MNRHFTDQYLLVPPHKVTVDLVGLGGTGSQVLSNLARMNEALMALAHPGLHVRAWDPDVVTDANIGRQLFSTSDIGINKAIVLVTRVNRFFGYEWQAVPEIYTGKLTSNIIITCVDTAAARIRIGARIEDRARNISSAPTDRLIYWLDLGNSEKTGQVVLGTLTPVRQPSDQDLTVSRLKTVTKKFKLKTIKDDESGPSCSLAEALNKQDLFINSTLAQFGCNLLWKMFREGVIRYHGCYVNLDSLIVNPIKIA